MHEGRHPENARQGFRRRAAAEAARYGGDAWVFLRELVQNARDAGATWVDITAERIECVDRVAVRDDGAGMSLEHARRYLFKLYASSKRGDDLAGRFGVGFWSVLRFQPERIDVCSSPRSGARPWGRRLRGDLEEVGKLQCTLSRGTEVVLERPSRGEDVVRAVQAALARDARYVRRRDGKPLVVRLNGRLQTGPLELPPPSLLFATRGLRGAVGLGPEPRVELYAHGLRVRTAVTLDDLLAGGGSAADAPSVEAEGVFPQVILDSDRLQPLLARSDARDDRELRRVVRRARRELDRLVRAQLDREARRGALRRALHRVAPAGRRWWWMLAVGVVLAAVVLWGQARPDGREHPLPVREPAPRPYADLAGSYAGPAVDVLAGAAGAVDLAYRPPGRRPLLAAAHVVGFDAEGRPVMASPAGALRAGGACVEGCLEMEVMVDTPAGVLRLPVATGHVLDAGRVRGDDLRGGAVPGSGAVPDGPGPGGRGAGRRVAGRARADHPCLLDPRRSCRGGGAMGS